MVRDMHYHASLKDQKDDRLAVWEERWGQKKKENIAYSEGKKVKGQNLKNYLLKRLNQLKLSIQSLKKT